VNSVRARIGYVAILAVFALLTLAAPAGAATPVVANEKFKWFYWIGVLLVVSLVLWLIATLVGYYVRVIRPKSRGRESR
jgi:hypothetical protein